MVVFYFGADQPNEKLQLVGYRRRNTILLKALSDHPSVEKLVSFNETGRKNFLKHIVSNFRFDNRKIKDVYFTELFVFGKYKFGYLNRLFNRIYFSILKNTFSGKDVIGWVYWPNGYMDFKKVNIRVGFIFDADHNIIDDPNLPKEDKVGLEKLLKEISQKSGLVVCASKSMLEWFKENGAKLTFRLRNGIDLSRFAVRTKNKPGRFTAVYCGILSNWVDYNLLIQIVEKNPDIDFVIIGKPFLSNSYHELGNHSNVYLLGEKSVGEVAELLPGFHAGLGFYIKDPFLDGDSMKIYEYLAAGLPVVCTRYHSSLQEDFNDLLFLGDSFSEFNKNLQDIKAGKLYLDKERVDAFLENATWEKRISEVLINFKN